MLKWWWLGPVDAEYTAVHIKSAAHHDNNVRRAQMMRIIDKLPKATLGSNKGCDCSNGLRLLLHLVTPSGNVLHDSRSSVIFVLLVANILYFTRSSAVFHVGRVLCLSL